MTTEEKKQLQEEHAQETQDVDMIQEEEEEEPDLSLIHI